MLNDIFLKLNKKLPSDVLDYDSTSKILSFYGNNLHATFTKSNNNVRMSIRRNGKQYDYILKNEKEVYYVIKRLYKGKISFDETDSRSISVKGLLWYRLNYKPLATKIFMIVLGLAITIASSFMVLAGIFTFSDGYRQMGYYDIGLFIMLFFFIAAGIALIIGAFGRYVYEGLHFISLFLSGFSICMFFYGIEDLVSDKDYGMRNLISTIVLFGFMLLSGILFMIMSLLKKKSDSVVIRRTPVLPPDEKLSILFDKIYENKKVQTLSLNLTGDIPKYSGSRIGGNPYTDGTIDTNEVSGMTFLGQINLAQIETPSKLPSNGLLQFFFVEEGDYELEVETLYYPHIDEQRDEFCSNSKSLQVTSEMWPEIKDTDVSDIYAVAAELGIPLEADLEFQDFYDQDAFPKPKGDYLLGPIRNTAPETLDTEADSYSIPLFSISSDSPIITHLCSDNSVYLDGLQVFISDECLRANDFSDVYTVMNFYYW